MRGVITYPCLNLRSTFSLLTILTEWLSHFVRPEPRIARKNEANIYTLRPAGNSRHFADDIFKSIFLNEICCFPIQNSLKLLPKSQIGKKSPIGSDDGVVPFMRPTISIV